MRVILDQLDKRFMAGLLSRGNEGGWSRTGSMVSQLLHARMTNGSRGSLASTVAVRQHYDPEKDNEPTMYAPGVFPEGYLEKCEARVVSPFA